MSTIDISASPTQALGVGAGSTDDVMSQMYGYLGWALNIPDVAAILRQAAADFQATGVAWSQAQMDSALMKTDWWKTTSNTARQFTQDMANDPASQNQKIQQKVADLQNQLQQQGVEIDPGRLHNMAIDSLRFGWDDIETKAALDSELMRQPSILNSAVGTNYKALARQYAVNLSDDQIQQWAAHSISGIRSDQMYHQYLMGQAKSLFRNNADLTKFIDDGGTVDQFADPFRQDAAKLLGVNPDTIDFTDPKWMAALNSQQVDPNGKPVGTVGPMTRAEWLQKLKDDPQYGYSRTPNGINEYSDLADKIDQQWGGLAGIGR